MTVLNAAGLTPISHHKPSPSPSSSPDKKPELKKLIPFKLPRALKTSFAALTSALSANGLAKALTYEEALKQSVGSGSSDFEIGLFLDGIVKFVAENPLIVGGGAAVVAVPLILSQFLSEPKKWGVQSAKTAYAKLGEDAGAQLVDIREAKEIREAGRPDVRGLKKKAVAIAYRGDDKNGFLKKLGLKFKDPENTTLYILDKFDGNSELVAELVTANGFKAAYAIKDGFSGPRGWINSGLPWLQPKKGLSFDFGDLFGDTSGNLPVTIALAAATGIGFFAYTEMETILEILGSAAILQLLVNKLLPAKERKTTIQQIGEFLNTKIAPQELVDDFKKIGNALLPGASSSNTLPSPISEKSEVSETKPEVKEETSTEVTDGAPPPSSKPLSPYPNYPELKPPSSPSPSQP